jgi:flagellar protein FlaH
MELLSFKLSRDELNQRLGKGLPPGSIVLIEGGHGEGKSVLCQRIAYGFLNNQHSVAIVSTQHTVKDFIKQMYSLEYPVMKFLVKGTLLYISVYPLVSETKPHFDFLDKFMRAKAIFEMEVIFVDTLSALIKYNSDETKIVDFMSFLKRLTGYGKIVVLCCEPEDINISTQLRSIADIYITTKSKVMGTDIKHLIIVNKYNGAMAPFAGIIGFRIEPNIGFVIEISSVS